MHEKLNAIKNIALSSGLGLIIVNKAEELVEEIINPVYNIIPFYLEDIRNEIQVLKTQKKETRSFSSFGRTHVLNCFCPLFLFGGDRIKTKGELKEGLVQQDWRNKTYGEFISGANTIGLNDIFDFTYLSLCF